MSATDTDFLALLERPAAARPPPPDDHAAAVWIKTLADYAATRPELDSTHPRDLIDAIRAELDDAIERQINLILHHPDFQALEASWRGLHLMARAAEAAADVKLRFVCCSKRELARSLRKYRGTAWDRSPLFRMVYEEEYGQFGGEPYGALIGDYLFDHLPEDVKLLADIAQIAAAAHAPFIAGAAPAILNMESWRELANPRDLLRIFQTADYVAWKELRAAEDSRYLALCLPRFLARLPYGRRENPVDHFIFEEDTDSPNGEKLLWANAAFAFGANLLNAFATWGWCARIRGVDGGGLVEDLPAAHFTTADGDVDRRGVVEITLSERREADLARAGLIPLVQRKNECSAVFISAHSLQEPRVYDDPEATANANLSARLPYLFPCCRFAHYLKCIVRDKVGSTKNRAELEAWLATWLHAYIDGSPRSSSDEWKSAHPLQDAQVKLADKPDAPGFYEARFYLRPHYQLEGLTVALRLVSRVAGTG